MLLFTRASLIKALVRPARPSMVLISLFPIALPAPPASAQNNATASASAFLILAEPASIESGPPPLATLNSDGTFLTVDGGVLTVKGRGAEVVSIHTGDNPAVQLPGSGAVVGRATTEGKISPQAILSNERSAAIPLITRLSLPSTLKAGQYNLVSSFTVQYN